jgi:hypothetical protein
MHATVEKLLDTVFCVVCVEVTELGATAVTTSSCCYGRGQGWFGSPEEGECPPLETITRRRLLKTMNKKNSVASVRKRAIPTERPPLVSEVRANFLRIEGATWSA